jgi:hypothetical protein
MDLRSRRRRRPFVPDRLDKPFDGYHFVRAQQQDGEQYLFPRSGNGLLAASVVEQYQWTKRREPDAVPHGLSSLPSGMYRLRYHWWGRERRMVLPRQRGESSGRSARTPETGSIGDH